MSLSIHSAVLDNGVAIPVTLEFSASYQGLPGITFVGLPRASVLESRERVFAALRSLKILLPRAKVTVNMLPVDLPKQGSSLDLAIALGLLMLHGLVPFSRDLAAVGELGLAGEVRSPLGEALLVECLLPLSTRIYSSSEKLEYLGLVSQTESVLPLTSLKRYLQPQEIPNVAMMLARSKKILPAHLNVPSTTALQENISDSLAKVLSLALVGGHHLLVYGSHGIGKSYIKTYLSSLLPPLQKEDARKRVLQQTGYPSESYSHSRIAIPHTSATVAGLLGGGTPFRPGALHQAHLGVLFLDEFPEFKPEVLESLRQPLEEEKVTLMRSGRSHVISSVCTVIATANPCPCGYFGESRCTCSFARVARYMQRLSGPLLDRFSLQYRLQRDSTSSVSLSSLAEQIAQARIFQDDRGRKDGLPRWARNYIETDFSISKDVLKMSEGMDLSPRRKLHIARVARSLADLDQSHQLLPVHWREAAQLTRASWG